MVQILYNNEILNTIRYLFRIVAVVLNHHTAWNYQPVLQLQFSMTRFYAIPLWFLWLIAKQDQKSTRCDISKLNTAKLDTAKPDVA